jgi:superfamily I DNA/RNA helicase
LHMSPDDVYNVIYIDEAQDFQKEWIEFIFHSLLSGKPDERNLVIAGDDMQRIYKNRSFATAAGFTWKDLGIPMTGHSRVLKKIYRNSARVWAYAAAFLGDISGYYEDDKSGIEFSPKRGFDPQLISCKDLDEQVEAAADIVGQLAEHGYSPRNAMILYRRVNVKGYQLIPRLLKTLEQTGIPYQWITEDNEAKATFRWASDSVKISTVHSAKGMDAPVVVVLSAETFRSGDTQAGEQDEEKLMYVALTRAREFLVILHTGDDGMVPRLKTAMSTYKKYRNEILELEEAANRETFA